MINIANEKINAIKAIREFTLVTFGVQAGLKASKDFVEHIQNESAVEKRRMAIETFNRAVHAAKDAGLLYHEVINHLNDIL